MRIPPMWRLTPLLLASALVAACSTPHAFDLTADEASLQVREYLDDLWANNPEFPMMPARFPDYFSVLAVEVMEMTGEGEERRVRCDIAVAPLEPIPADALGAELFNNIVGSGPKPGPLIVTHTFVFRQYEGYWLLETMND